MKEERFPHTSPFAGGDCGWQRGEASEPRRRERSHRGAEGKAERFPHRGSAPSSTHQPERLGCSPAEAGGVWELRLGLWSDHRERTGVGGVNTA